MRRLIRLARVTFCWPLPLPPPPQQTNARAVVNGARHPLARLRPDPPAHRGAATSTGTRPRSTAGSPPPSSSLRPALDSVVLDMGRTLEVRSGHAAVRAGRALFRLAFTRPGDSLVVRLPGPRPSATRSGSPWTTAAGSGRATGSTSSRPSRAGRTARSRCTAAAAPTAIRTGFPPRAAPHDKATWELIATVPAGSPSSPTAGW